MRCGFRKGQETLMFANAIFSAFESDDIDVLRSLPHAKLSMGTSDAVSSRHHPNVLAK